MMTHKTTPTTRMTVLIWRRRVGANSRFNQPTQSESSGCASSKVALIELFPRRTFDDRDRGRAHAEKILVRVFDFDTHRKALRDAHPVEFALHVRNAAEWQIDLAFGLHCPSDPLHFSTETLVRRGRKI